MLSVDIANTKLDDITKQDIIVFLDKRKKPIEIDPDKKWERTWNDYLARLVGFTDGYTTKEQKSQERTGKHLNHLTA